jgi:tetratricopeptide (TPR) repeat protein
MGERLPSIEEKFNDTTTLDHTKKLLNKGYESLQAGDFSKAKMLFLKVLETDPTNPFAMMNMGVIYEKEGRNDLAMKMYQEIVAGGSDAVADKSNDPDKTGMTLRNLAMENLERLKKNGKGK